MNVNLPELAQGGKWQRPVFLTVSAAAAVLVVFLAREVMLPLILGVVIAYVLTPLVEWVETRKVPRGLAIVVVYVGVLGTLGGFVRLVAPRLGSEIAKFARDVPHMTSEVKTHWIPSLQERLQNLSGVAPPPESPPKDEPPELVVRPQGDGSFAVELEHGIAVHHTRDGGYLVERVGPPGAFDPDRFVAESVQGSLAYARQNALELARIGGAIVASVSRFFFIFGLTLMVAAYLMLTKERIERFFLSLVRPSARPSFERLIDRIDRGLSGVVRGQLIICLINGVLSAIGFAVLGVKYWPILAVIATIFSLVPIFGSIASAVPAVALALTQSFSSGLLVLGWIVCIHQLEANILNPKIMGDAAKIHPVLVIFSLLVGEHFFHTVGALLAVPTMSIAQSVFIHFRQIVQEMDPELANEPVASIPPPRR